MYEGLWVFCSSTRSCGLLWLPRQPGVYIQLLQERKKIEMEKRMGCREMREREREAEMVSGETERERVKKMVEIWEKNENRT